MITCEEKTGLFAIPPSEWGFDGWPQHCTRFQSNNEVVYNRSYYKFMNGDCSPTYMSAMVHMDRYIYNPITYHASTKLNPPPLRDFIASRKQHTQDAFFNTKYTTIVFDGIIIVDYMQKAHDADNFLGHLLSLYQNKEKAFIVLFDNEYMPALFPRPLWKPQDDMKLDIDGTFGRDLIAACSGLLLFCP